MDISKAHVLVQAYPSVFFRASRITVQSPWGHSSIQPPAANWDEVNNYLTVLSAFIFLSVNGAWSLLC